MKALIVILFALFVYLAFCVGLGLLFALPVMLLWNYLAPLFSAPELSIWQAWGLNVLCGLLFKTVNLNKK